HPRTSELSTLSLHDALPISAAKADRRWCLTPVGCQTPLIKRSSIKVSHRPRRFADVVGADIQVRDQPGGPAVHRAHQDALLVQRDRKSTRLNSSHVKISYAV